MTTDWVVVNAVIKHASVQLDRGSFLTVWLDLDYGSSVQGFGGYVLGGTPDCAAGKHSERPNYAAEFIVGCLRAADVEKFSDLTGKTIRVRKTDSWGDIIGIGHIVRDDRWFCPKQTFAAWKSQAPASGGESRDRSPGTER